MLYLQKECYLDEQPCPKNVLLVLHLLIKFLAQVLSRCQVQDKSVIRIKIFQVEVIKICY
jgi:hypothetical protein